MLTDTHRAASTSWAAAAATSSASSSDAVGSTDDQALTAVLWDLVWSGHLTNDTIAPLRSFLSGSRHPPPSAYDAARPDRRSGGVARSALGRPGMPTRTGPPTVAGRWSRTPEREADPTRRAHATAEALLERHGVVTRGAVVE